MTSTPLRPVSAALTVAAIGAATILGAYYFQYVLGYLPCPLCFEQRIPYYLAIPLALILAIGANAAPPAVLRAGLVLLALVMLVSAGLGIYHAGVEWKWWTGPTECSGALNLNAVPDLTKQIQSTIVVRCDEAAWRLLGLSLAGYNVLISLLLAAIALGGAAHVSARAGDRRG